MLCKHLAASTAAILSLAAFATADVVEVPLTFQESSEMNDAVPYGSAGAQLNLEVPEGLVLPEFESDKPRFGSIALGESVFRYAIDASDGSDKNFDRLWFDANGNGDLTDETVLAGELVTFDASYWFCNFPETIVVDYELDGETYPYVITPSLNGQDLSEMIAGLPEGTVFAGVDESGLMIHFSLQTGCFYAGTLTVGDATYRLRLGDSDCDGRFGEVASIDPRMSFPDDTFYPQGDSLFLTQGDEFDYRDQILMGDHLQVAGGTFLVEMKLADSKLLLTPVTEGLAPLHLSPVPERMVLHAKDFAHTVMVLEPSEKVMLPAGAYRLVSYSLQKTGEKGDVWRLEATGTKKSPFVEVAVGEEARLPFGEPFAVSAEVAKWERERFAEHGGDGIGVDLRLRGAGEETVNDLGRVSGASAFAMSASNPGLPLEPTYTIVKSTGEKVAQGSFEYG